jgi:hypothetical protein
LVDFNDGALVDFKLGALVDFKDGALVDFKLGALVLFIDGALVDLDCIILSSYCDWKKERMSSGLMKQAKLHPQYLE